MFAFCVIFYYLKEKCYALILSRENASLKEENLYLKKLLEKVSFALNPIRSRYTNSATKINVITVSDVTKLCSHSKPEVEGSNVAYK